MNLKKVSIGIFLLSFVFLSFSMVSAAEFKDFLDASDITVTVNQDESHVDFSLDTAGYSWDTQNIDIQNENIGDVTIDRIALSFDISGLLNDFNAEAEIQRNSDIVQFNSLSITGNELVAITDVTIDGTQYVGDETFLSTRGLVQNIINWAELNINISDINSVNNYLSGHPIETSPSHVIFTKQGIDYTIWNNNGYGDVPEEWRAEIIDIISTSVQSVNLQNILTGLLPMLESEPEFQAILNELNANLNTDFEVTDVDLSVLNLNASTSNLSEIQLEDGNYTIPVTVSNGEVSYTKNVNLVVYGIHNDDSGTPVAGTYTPTSPEVSRYLIGINGLGINTVDVSLFDVFSSNLPSNTANVIKYMEILVTTPTSGTIDFRVPIEDVDVPSRVGLYVLEGSNWVGLSTTFLGEVTTGFYHYSATTPHFSTFMMMETLASTSGGGGSSRSDYYRYDSASNSCITVRETASEASRNGDFSTLSACQSRITTLTTPTGPAPIEATPETTPGAAGGGITGAFIGALGSPTGLVVLISALIGIVIVALVIRNVGSGKGKRKKINEEGDKNEV